MNFAGRINVVGSDNVPDLRIRSFTIGLQTVFYYPYYAHYSLQTMVGEEISS